MRRTILAAALGAAAAVFVGVSLPPPRLALAADQRDDSVAGALHVHTSASDGRSGPDEIAAAAARAGLQFIVFTDHGDATRVPHPPTYRHGVLCLEGVEISTADGHFIGLDLPASPYPLAGEARDVVEDVHRLGGFGVAAHPDSPKADLRWLEWNAPFDAFEIVNPDTSWRVHLEQRGWRSKLLLAQALATYPFRPAESMARLLVDSPATLARWDELTDRRRVVALAGVDAHAKLALRDVDPGDNRFSLPLPSYEASFRTLSVRVRPDQPLTGEAAKDAASILHALRRGHAHTVVDAIASPPFFVFTAANEQGAVREGDEIVAAGPLTLRVLSNAPPEFTTTIWQGTRVFSTGHHGSDIVVTAPATPAVYRVEIRATDRPGSPAWILSNPIYVRSAEPAGRLPGRPPARATTPILDARTAATWKAETDSTSLAALDVIDRPTGPELRLRYGLSGGGAGGQFAALTTVTPGGLAAHDRLTFTARAERPLRISVQVRIAVTPDEDERWQRSVYIDPAAAERTVYFDDLRPVGVTRTRQPPLADVHSLVLAIDTTNTQPGSSGRLWVAAAVLQR